MTLTLSRHAEYRIEERKFTHTDLARCLARHALEQMDGSTWYVSRGVCLVVEPDGAIPTAMRLRKRVIKREVQPVMRLIHGSAHHIPDLADGSVSMICTSPPYWSLRKYSGEQDIEWPAVSYAPMAGLDEIEIPAQVCPLGLEKELTAYIGHLILCLREWRRVLHPSGVCFVNLGDSYAANRAMQVPDSSANGNRSAGISSVVSAGLKPKDLCMVPARFALAAQADGWWLRSEIIWNKPNPMPESVTDRCTRSHEMVYMLAKNARYFYDADAVREPHVRLWDAQTNGGSMATGRHDAAHIGGTNRHDRPYPEPNPAGRNLRDVWTIATQPTPMAHFATYPEKLVEPCIRAGSSQRGVCPKCGAPYDRIVEKETPVYNDKKGAAQALRCAGAINGGTAKVTLGVTHLIERRELGWRASCTCDAGEPVPATVLDPFHGSGTTGKVALRLGRAYVGVDLSQEYLGEITDARFANGVQVEMPL